jgi:hypothetical protein
MWNSQNNTYNFPIAHSRISFSYQKYAKIKSNETGRNKYSERINAKARLTLN